MIKYMGTVDSVNTCDCCGKINLKKTVALDFNGDIRYLGIVCAGNSLGKKTKTDKDVSSAVNQVNELDRIKEKVDSMNSQGHTVVYGRFYINLRILKTHLKIGEVNERLAHRIYPKTAD